MSEFGVRFAPINWQAATSATGSGGGNPGAGASNERFRASYLDRSIDCNGSISAWSPAPTIVRYAFRCARSSTAARRLMVLPSAKSQVGQERTPANVRFERRIRVS